jgi:hypothetical protein
MSRDDSYNDAEGRARFVMNVVREAELARDDFLPRWEEAWRNYLVVPHQATSYSGRTDNPLGRTLYTNQPRRNNQVILKAPESHQIVESLLAETLTQLFPEDGFVKARPTGGEDWPLAEGTNQIIEHAMGRPEPQLVLYRWLKDIFVYGTGVMFGDWEFEEDFEIVRTIAELGNFSVSQFGRALVTVKDDVRFENVDLIDFYPVPGEDSFQRLKGAARRVELYGDELRTEAKAAPDEEGWNMEALEVAIENGFELKTSRPEEFKVNMTEDAQDTPMDEFSPVVGYEYWGVVPWAGTEDDPIKEGSSRRRLLVVNGELVREQDWPLKRASLPFFGHAINPITGRLYGLSPLEVVRFDQDFADVIKQMLAMAVVKSTNPPHIINAQQNVSAARMAAFRQDLPIMVDGDVRTAVAQAQYQPPIHLAQGVYQDMVIPNMKEASGAQGGVQGQGLGSKRFSASEAQSQFRAQFARPNMIAQLIEKVALPGIGAFVLDQYALNIEDNASLKERFGDDFEVTLQELQKKHDVRFVGGRREHDKLSKAAGLERFLAVVSQIPEVRAQIPWAEFLKIYAKAVDIHDLTALIGSNETLAENAQLQALLSQFQGGAGNGANAPAPAGPAGAAELAGAEVPIA